MEIMWGNVWLGRRDGGREEGEVNIGRTRRYKEGKEREDGREQ